MSNLKHTGKKWKYTISKIHGTHQISEFETGRQICKMWMRGKEVTTANALLIASAPEMLEMLIHICKTESINGLEELLEKVTGMTIDEVLNDK